MRRMATIATLFLSVVGLFLSDAALAAQNEAPALQAERCFPETNQCISGRFRAYWEQNGGLAVFGYPITLATNETSANGTLLTQWFERNRFELHPENAAPYDVLLGRLGDDRLVQLARTWQSEPKGTQQADCTWFAETSHSVCKPFKSYWERNGLQDPTLNAYGKSLALFGLPLTEASFEVNAAGATVVMQWFERARFECHPGNPPGQQVLLGLLGNEVRANQPIADAGTPVQCTVTVAQPTPRPQPTTPPAPRPQPTTPPPTVNCDPSYPDVCIPPPPPDLDCGDIPYKRFRVIGRDPHRFDGDNDGIGCES